MQTKISSHKETGLERDQIDLKINSNQKQKLYKNHDDHVDKDQRLRFGNLCKAKTIIFYLIYFNCQRHRDRFGNFFVFIIVKQLCHSWRPLVQIHSFCIEFNMNDLCRCWDDNYTPHVVMKNFQSSILIFTQNLKTCIGTSEFPTCFQSNLGSGRKLKWRAPRPFNSTKIRSTSMKWNTQVWQIRAKMCVSKFLYTRKLTGNVIFTLNQL